MKIANIGCILLAVKAYLKLGSTSEKWIDDFNQYRCNLRKKQKAP